PSSPLSASPATRHPKYTQRKNRSSAKPASPNTLTFLKLLKTSAGSQLSKPGVAAAASPWTLTPPNSDFPPPAASCSSESRGVEKASPPKPAQTPSATPLSASI